MELQTYFNCFIAHTFVGFSGYLIFGGWRLFSKNSRQTDSDVPSVSSGPDSEAEPVQESSFELKHGVTLSVIGGLIFGVLFFGVHVGMGAFAGAVLLTLLRMADEVSAVKMMPWGPILMVSGVTVLIGLLEKTGGLALFTEGLARFSSQGSVTAVVAFVTGFISAYSSTSGVVLPAFLPTVPGLVERLGGGDPWAVASAMNVGAHLVDVSPISTIGALCVAAAPSWEDHRLLFNKVLAWGLSMSVVGAAYCYVRFGLLG